MAGALGAGGRQGALHADRIESIRARSVSSATPRASLSAASRSPLGPRERLQIVGVARLERAVVDDREPDPLLTSSHEMLNFQQSAGFSTYPFARERQ